MPFIIARVNGPGDRAGARKKRKLSYARHRRQLPFICAGTERRRQHTSKPPSSKMKTMWDLTLSRLRRPIFSGRYWASRRKTSTSDSTILSVLHCLSFHKFLRPCRGTQGTLQFFLCSVDSARWFVRHFLFPSGRKKIFPPDCRTPLPLSPRMTQQPFFLSWYAHTAPLSI